MRRRRRNITRSKREKSRRKRWSYCVGTGKRGEKSKN